MMKRFAFILIGCIALFFNASVSEASDRPFPDTKEIDIFNTGFTPQVITIPVNTEVIWTNLEGVHTTTSHDGLWDSGVLVTNDTFSYTFNDVGLYYYCDTIHDWPCGTIEVIHSPAEIDIFTDSDVYYSGDTVSMGVQLSNPGVAVQAGIYIWLQSPSGTITWLLAVPSVTVPEGFSFYTDPWMAVPLPPSPRGEYSLHAALVKVPEMAIFSMNDCTWTFGQAMQTSWCSGPEPSSPVQIWGKGFSDATSVSWRSIEKSVALSAETRPTPLSDVIAYDAGRSNCVAVADLNGDGRNEVITTDPVYDIYNDWGAIYWYELQETGIWEKNTITDTFYGAYHVDGADVDSDGDMDVIVAAYYGDGPELGRNGKYAWFENLNGDATAWQMHLVGDLFWGAIFIDAGDIDGDGDIDLTGASQLTDGINEQEADLVWFENLDGKGDTWGQHDVDLFFPNASESHLADLDGDQDLDIVGTYSHPTGPSTFAWWENESGDGSSLIKRFIPFEFWGSGYVDTGDIDGDGDIDLMGSGYNSGQVGWWENLDGQGTSWQAWAVTVMPSGRGASLCDLDGDGDLDGLLWSSYQVLWVENLAGNGFSWTTHYLNYQTNRPFAVAADVDNDGKLDIAVANEDFAPPHSAQVFWYDITQFTGAGSLTSSVLDGDLDPGWGLISWDAEIPGNTTFSLEVRASNDPLILGNFVPVPQTGYDLSGIIDPMHRYLQYRINFNSTTSDASPVLHDVKVEVGDGF